jgi:hypothetical protein
MIALGGALVLSIFLTGLYAWHASGDDGPIVGKHVDYMSPNGKWVATLEVVDNGLGYGQGWLYGEVHLRRPDEPITRHGERAESAVFYMASAGNPPDEISVDWLDAKHLVIAYDGSSRDRPGKGITRFHGISIEYRVRARS